MSDSQLNPDAIQGMHDAMKANRRMYRQHQLLHFRERLLENKDDYATYEFLSHTDAKNIAALRSCEEIVKLIKGFKPSSDSPYGTLLLYIEQRLAYLVEMLD